MSENNNDKNCLYCNKVFSRLDNLKRHQIKCKTSNIQLLKTELKNEIKNELKKEINNTNKKITTNINVNGNLINGTNNNNQKMIINKTGFENIDKLTYSEVSTIFDNEISSVIKLIELVNFNELKPENHSFCSTNLESSYLSIYNTDTNKINKERKRYFFEEVICKSIQNHEILYSKYKHKFNYEKRKKIEDNIANLKSIKENSFNSRIMGELIRKLNLISYNNKELIQNTWNGKPSDNNNSDEEFIRLVRKKRCFFLI
jgi:hypothetical protein